MDNLGKLGPGLSTLAEPGRAIAVFLARIRIEASMPLKSKAQQQAAGAALLAKRGKRTEGSLKGASKGMVESMSGKQLEKLASTSQTGTLKRLSKRKWCPGTNRERACCEADGCRTRYGGRGRHGYNIRMPRRCAVVLLTAILLAAGCVDRSRYLELAGGGFIFNYRNAVATYGVVLLPRRDPPPGSTIEATFENPAGGDPIVISRPARGGGRIELQTPPLQGIEKDRPYHVVVTLKSADGEELLRLERDYSSDVDQAVLPQRPLAIGPGYQRNMDDSTVPFPPSLYAPPPARPPG
jgi:hypothetical protein